MEKQPVCVLVGPTASGKTGASLAVAERLGMEIVSADSMQVYRGMDVGTAKATPQERARVRHHMIDIADPTEKYTAARYRQEGARVLAALHARGVIPLVVGGTGLYVSALIDGLNFGDVQGGGEARALWEGYLADNGAQALHDRLRACDPVTAERLHPNDTRRVVRALEVFTCTGKPISQGARREDSPYALRIAGLKVERETLYRRIDERVLQMVRDGLVEEAKKLHSHEAVTASQALGYKELYGAFRGEYTVDDAVELIQRETRRYAKRQMTWFKRDDRICWFDATDPSLVESLTEYFGEANFTRVSCNSFQ